MKRLYHLILISACIILGAASSSQAQSLFVSSKSVSNQFSLPTTVSNLTMWLDASDLSGFSYSQFGNSLQLQQRNDKSANINHMSQSNITLMPVVQTGAGGINKVVFDPTNGGDSLARAVLNAAPSTETTIFVVGTMTKAGDNRFLSTTPYYGTGGTVGFGFGFADQMSLRNYGSVGYSGSTTYSLSAPTIWTVESKAGVNGLVGVRRNGDYLNGIGLPGSAVGIAGYGLIIGASTFGNGYDVYTTGALGGSISELIMYNTTLSTTDRSKIEQYLTNKYLGGSHYVTVSYTLTNISSTQADFVALSDVIPQGLQFVSGSTLINGTGLTAISPVQTAVSTGTQIDRVLGTVPASSTVTISYTLLITDYSRRYAQGVGGVASYTTGQVAQCGSAATTGSLVAPTTNYCSVGSLLGAVSLTGTNQWTRVCSITTSFQSTQQCTTPSASVPVNSADLRVTAHYPTIMTGTTGQAIGFTIMYDNLGPVLATGVTLDVITSPYFVYSTGSRAPNLITGTTIRYSLGDIGVGATGHITITGSISTTGVLGQTFSHFGQIYSSTLDGVLNNNGLTSSGITITLANGSTGTTSTIDPLPVLQELVAKYNAIITRNNPPKLMNDVSTSPFLSHILTIVNNGIMKGYSTPRSARFAPEKDIDRGEFITVVGRVLSIGTTNTNQVYSYFAPTRFADVPASSSYARFVNQLDTLGMLEGLITKGSDGSLHLHPNKKITQTEVKTIMVEVLKRRGYDSNPIQTFPDGEGTVKRGEVAFLMTEVIRGDPNVVLGNNHKFLQVMVNRLVTLDIAGRRNLITRFLDKINTVSPDRMFSIGLYPKALTRDLTDALNGKITAKNPTLLPIYNTSGGSNDPLEQLLNEWSQ